MRKTYYYILTLFLGLFLVLGSEGCAGNSPPPLPRGHGGQLRGHGKHNPHRAHRRMHRSHRRH